MLVISVGLEGAFIVCTHTRIAFWTYLCCIGVLVAGCEDSPLRNFVAGKSVPEFPAVPAPGDAAPTPAPAMPETTAGPASQTRFDDDAKLADDFPKDVPLYTRGKVVMTEESQDRTSFKVQLKSTDDPAAIRAFYDRALTDLEWKSDQGATDTKDDDLMTLGFTKGEDRFLSVTLIKNVDGDGLNIVVSTGQTNAGK